MKYKRITKDHKVMFGTLLPEGTLRDVRLIKKIDIGKCPHYICSSEHYRADGTCKCDDPIEQAMLIKEFGYTKRDFNKSKKTGG